MKYYDGIRDFIFDFTEEDENRPIATMLDVSAPSHQRVYTVDLLLELDVRRLGGER